MYFTFILRLLQTETWSITTALKCCVLLWSSAVFMVAYSLVVICPVAEGAVTAEITVFVLLRV